MSRSARVKEPLWARFISPLHQCRGLQSWTSGLLVICAQFFKFHILLFLFLNFVNLLSIWGSDHLSGFVNPRSSVCPRLQRMRTSGLDVICSSPQQTPLSPLSKCSKRTLTFQTVSQFASNLPTNAMTQPGDGLQAGNP